MTLRRGQDRPAAVAGAFYPASPAVLEADVAALLRQARQLATGAAADPAQAPAAVLVVPHAGYVYSGPAAARAFAAAPPRPERVILVGPAHRVALRGLSAGDFAHYRCPLGALPVDRDAIAELEAAKLATVVPEAHAEEHCLEVMLPWLWSVYGDVPIVPLLVGDAAPTAVDAALERLLRPGDLLLVSTDLSHFLPYDVARRRDLATLEALAAGRWGDIGPHEACGYRGLGAAMRLAARRGWQPTVIAYQSSGDTAGDRQRVVGYGAASFTPA